MRLKTETERESVRAGLRMRGRLRVILRGVHGSGRVGFVPNPNELSG